MKKSNPIGKYKKAGVVGNYLINNFFNNIKNVVDGKKFENALELGCGSGISTKRISEFLKYNNFEASDVELDYLSKAKEYNPGINFSQESIYELKRLNSCCDIVFVLEVFEHLENPEKALKEVHRVTKKYAIISVPNEPLWRFLNFFRGKYVTSLGNTPEHIQHWNGRSLRRLLEKYFNILSIKKPCPWLIFYVEKK